MVFLMLTVALGIFNATVARTILSNSESNIRYETGATLVLKEQWRATKRSLRIIRIRKYPIRSRIFRPMRA